MDNKGRRKSSASSIDTEKLTKLREMKLFSQGGVASKLLKKGKAPAVTDEESAASALSRAMARKKVGEPMSLQIEIETEAHWKLLLRREGLIVVEVYSGWSGPCTSMVSILKKVKNDADDDRLTLATVKSDNIPDLQIFKNQSEPVWLFIGGGKPVKLMRGANAAKLVAAIKEEFSHELLCVEGKAKRNLISIKDEAERKQRAETEAMRLAIKDKQESADENEEKTSPADEPEEREPLDRESLNEMRRQSNVRLMGALEKFTVIAVQGFLLETGAVTEIKDSLKSDFKIIQERYIYLQEDGVRHLFGIPFEIEELIEEEEPEPEELEDGDAEVEGEKENEDNELGVDTQEQIERPVSSTSEKDEKIGEDNEIGEASNEENEDDASLHEPEVVVPKYRTIPVPLPEELEGDTLLFLLESLEMKRLMDQEAERPLLHSADDYIRLKVGPHDFKDALENAPNSLHALYGRDEYSAGVWCPRKYDDKRYVMLNFFPRFVTEMLMPPPKEIPKYILAIFPALFANEIMESPELVSNKADIVAEGKMNIPVKLANRILKSKGLQGEDLEAQKRALTGFNMFVVSINERNSALAAAVASLEPIYMSTSNDNGRFETAKLFPYLNILIDDDYEEDKEIYRDLIVEKFLGRSKQKLEPILDTEITECNIDDRTASTTMDDNSNSYASQETLHSTQ